MNATIERMNRCCTADDHTIPIAFNNELLTYCGRTSRLPVGGTHQKNCACTKIFDLLCDEQQSRYANVGQLIENDC